MAADLHDITRFYSDMLGLLPCERTELQDMIFGNAELPSHAYLGEKLGMLKAFNFVTRTLWARSRFTDGSLH